MRRLFRWFTRLAILAALLPVILAVCAAGLFAPYFLDDQRLDTAVMAVALDWRDFGLDAAHERMQYELDHRHIGLWVTDDDCVLTETTAGKQVVCHWGVDVAIPFTEEHAPLAFQSVATIAPDGDLRF
jgi:hypothetical protein